MQVLGITINLLVIDAYETEADRFDLPDWGRSRFDVRVKIPPNTNAAGCRQMLRSLLAERFHMVTAVETRDMPTYFLKVAKTGLKLKPVDGPPADLRASLGLKSENGRTRWTFRAAPMARVFTSVEAGVVTGERAGILEADRVVDETGLTGYYDGELEYQHTPPNKTDGQLAQAPDLRDALVEQTGLMLELRKAPRKVLEIRSSDRMPTEN